MRGTVSSIIFCFKQIEHQQQNSWVVEIYQGGCKDVKGGNLNWKINWDQANFQRSSDFQDFLVKIIQHETKSPKIKKQLFQLKNSFIRKIKMVQKDK